MERLKAWGMRGVLLLSLLATAACQSSRPTDDLVLPPAVENFSRSGETNTETLAERDEVDIYVLEDERFNGRYALREKGDIILPRIGRISLAGMTPQAAEKAIKARLERDQLKTASVVLERVNYGSKMALADFENQVIVYVTGGVMRPGRTVLPELSGTPPTIIQAIVEAGGFARFSDQKNVLLLRRSGNANASRSYVDVAAIQRGKVPDIPLIPGDVIIVKEKTFGF